MEPNFWSVNGNANLTPGVHYLGTIGSVPLEFRTDHATALRLTPASSLFETPNVIGGSAGNIATNVFAGAPSGVTIGGGGDLFSPHESYGDYTTIGGGLGNRTGTTSGEGGVAATVGGGAGNRAVSDHATVGGGVDNTATGAISTVSGGANNLAAGYASAIPGGELNMATGSHSVAVGHQAHALHDGTFVWSDLSGPAFATTTNNQFLIRAANGVGIGTNRTEDGMLTVAGTVCADAFKGEVNGSSLVDGTVTGDKASAALRTKVVTQRIGGFSTTENRFLFAAPSLCQVTRVILISDTATTLSSIVRHWTFQVRNLSQANDLLATARSTSDSEIGVHTTYDLFPDQNQSLSANDILQLQITSTGGPTSLAAAEIMVQVE
ncbi:MAG: hypothetical protein AAF492_27045, partial [Verrucomicrobiota bacterium]